MPVFKENIFVKRGRQNEAFVNRCACYFGVQQRPIGGAVRDCLVLFEGPCTANGERFEKAKISAAHRTPAFGTKVTGTTSSMSVIVRINDRGPYIEDRIIGLSAGAKKALGMSDLAPVCIHVVRFAGKGAAIYKRRVRKRNASYRILPLARRRAEFHIPRLGEFLPLGLLAAFGRP